MPRRGRRIRSIYQRLGLAPSQVDPGRRGVVLVQIDALSFYAAKASLGRRFMPFLSRLVNTGYRMHRYTVGLPATTPAFQIGLMYGYNDHVPGFRWIDKARNLIRVMKGANDAREIEAEAARHGPPLLRGGACHCSLFGGGAERTSLTLSRFAEADPPMKLSWFSVLTLILLNLLSILRVCVGAVWEILVELYEATRAEYEGRLTRGPWPFLAVRVISNVAFRELATQHATIDLARGVPALYVNFAGYDELAHHRGPMSVSARLSLRGIDRHIRQIFRAASRLSDRAYDIYVFSDHGQTPSVPFDYLYGASLRDTLAKALFVGVDDLPEGMTDLEATRIQSLYTLQRELEQILPRPLARAARAVTRNMEAHISEGPYSRPYHDLSEIALMPTSDLCHLYFTSTLRKLTVAEARRNFPRVVDFLVRHPGIWAIAGVGEPDEHGVAPCELFNAQGTVRLYANCRQEVVGQSPFEMVELPDGMDEAIRRLTLLPESGDLVLFGARVHGRAVNFQGELGGHGGPYDEEQSAFIIVPPGIDFDAATIANSRDLYRFFYDRYRKDTATKG
jgi:hypothetical protein